MSTAAGPWSVKGIDPKAREIAKDLARKSGLTLGEWLNQMITETGEEPAQAAAPTERELEIVGARAGGLESAAARPAPPAPTSGGSVLNAESFRSRLREAGRGSEAGEVARITRALGDLTSRLEAAEHRSTLAISGIDQQAIGVLTRLEGVERDQTSAAAQLEGALDEVREAQAQVHERLQRMEDEDGPRVEALKALEGALGKVAAQIYEGESRARAQHAEVRQDVSAVARRVERLEAAPAPKLDSKPVDAAMARLSDRFEDLQGRTSTSVRALETAFGGLDERLARMEAAPAPAPDTSALDAAIVLLAQRMDEAQERTSAAVRELKTSFAGLDQRLAKSETGEGLAGSHAPQLERLAAELNERVEGARTEMAARLRDAAGGKLESMEAALRGLSSQVAATEQRSADAIDRLGREVVRVAHGLDGKIGEVERRSDARASAMGAEMARVADAVENRLAQADGAQAQALEKLGGEIARIAEKLAERISASERRNAQDLTRGLDDVGDRLQRATDKLNARYDTAASDLADRIRASEERTHRLLAEARGRVEAAPTPVAEPQAQATADVDSYAPIREAHEAVLEARTPPHGAGVIEDEDEPEFRADMFRDAPDAFASESVGGYEPTAYTAPVLDEGGYASDPFARAEPPAVEPASLMSHDAPEEDDDDPFAATILSPPEPHTDTHADAEPETAPRPSSTRELIEQARAAARANAEARGRRPSRAARPGTEDVFSTPAPGFEPQPAAAEARSGLFGLPKLRRRESSTAKTALYASGVAATLTLAGLGVALQFGSRPHGATSSDAPTAAPVASLSSPAMLAVAQTAADAPVETTAPRLDAADPAPSAPAAAPVTGLTLYNQAIRELARGDKGGVATLKKAADQGYAPAQFHLGKLYEDGASGVTKDLTEARRWTQRAAEAGEPAAMFNFANYLAEGDGGAKDETSALAWFRRAADAGVKDAQFDLGVMHQDGRGVPASAAEAYKWYLIAAADGDAGARQAADALKPKLSADAMGAAQRSAGAYHAQIAAAAAKSALRTASR